MARLPRLWMEGVPEHVVVRATGPQAIVRSDGDRLFLYRCLTLESREFGIQVHAYVLMDNHVHLLVSAPEAGSLSSFVQSVGRRYVPYFNYVHQRTGTLWQGRFWANPVQTERYLMTCQRYVELNPVRAGMVRHPSAYAWSSHRCNVQGIADDLVTPHPVFLALAGDTDARRSVYQRLFEQELSSETVQMIRDALQGGWALGSADFATQLERASGRPAAPRPRGGSRKAAEVCRI